MSSGRSRANFRQVSERFFVMFGNIFLRILKRLYFLGGVLGAIFYHGGGVWSDFSWILKGFLKDVEAIFG